MIYENNFSHHGIHHEALIHNEIKSRGRSNCVSNAMRVQKFDGFKFTHSAIIIFNN